MNSKNPRTYSFELFKYFIKSIKYQNYWQNMNIEKKQAKKHFKNHTQHDFMIIMCRILCKLYYKFCFNKNIIIFLESSL